MIENQSYLVFPLSPQDLQTLIREQIEDAFKKFMTKEEDELLPIKEVCKRMGVSAQRFMRGVRMAD